VRCDLSERLSVSWITWSIFVRQSYLLCVNAVEERASATMVISIVTGSPVGWCGRRKVAIAAGILMFIKFKILSANYKYPTVKKLVCGLVFQGRK
jgi:hypothetical protein